MFSAFVQLFQEMVCPQDKPEIIIPFALSGGFEIFAIGGL